MVVSFPGRVGVIGHPIGHSLSPALHSSWIEHHQIDAEYVPIDPGPTDEDFEAFVRGALARGHAGYNVTVPFKAAAFRLANTCSPTAERIGTANLLVFRDGKIHADNTDSYGAMEAVSILKRDERMAYALVLGAGGAAPAVVEALKTLECEEILITNRSIEKAEALRDRFGLAGVVPWGEKSTYLANLDLLVNTTSLGMAGMPPLQIDLTTLPSSAAVLDIVTTPLETPLLQVAKAKGCPVQNGVPMLVHQAIPSFAAWFGVTPTDADARIADLYDRLRKAQA